MTIERLRRFIGDMTSLVGGAWQDRDETAMLDPARLAWGLARAAESLGVRIVEGVRVTGLDRVGGAVEVTTAGGETIRAARVSIIPRSCCRRGRTWRAGRAAPSTGRFRSSGLPITR